MVQRCLCVLLVDFQSLYRSQASAETVADEFLDDSGIPESDRECFQTTVLSMMSRGGYYRHLESTLGKGVILAMGTKIGETT